MLGKPQDDDDVSGGPRGRKSKYMCREGINSERMNFCSSKGIESNKINLLSSV